ncbi:MAG: NAD-dependent epimerase/dehydratase family protein [Chloroflexi bacterium]|nr:NAD-dependent epimerase/dehydratase family protein [Chloroflexota bacterium]MCI0580094.1 NAD-dependent epimerase/dehydratase family protein [Chloroflexota bacterium]MCI0649330.1 NAD-dependent epimerase/dehydratase family protein [Chloroflexota bacterium]MCI0726026.1 NAD-dependent epimerase/dehydratase family protein [Chloroflexota bacterium]
MILITGSTGFVGRSLMQTLQEEGRPAKTYTGRMNDPLGLRAELLDVDTVVHLASSEARGRDRLLQHVDVEGTERLLEESRRMEVRRLIFLSRLNADPHSLYPLLQAKGEVERLIRHSGLTYTILRSATLFGRDDRFLNLIAGLAAWSWPFVWLPGGGRVAMQPLWVEDLVRCLLATLDRPDLLDETVEVAGEERFRYGDVVRQILAVTGLRRIRFSPSVKLVRPVAALLFGWRRRPPVTHYFLDRFTVPEVAPTDAVRRQFGFVPTRMGQQMAYLRRPPLRRLFQPG